MNYYLFAAYSAVWVIFFLYLYSLKSRQRSLEKSIEGLQKRLEQR